MIAMDCIRMMRTSSYRACALMLLGATAFAGSMGTQVPAGSGMYLGVFGGGGAVSSTRLSQFATVLYSEAQGGPLAVNAFGQSDRDSVWLVGARLGYRWLDRTWSSWRVTPALELEGYYLSASLEGDDLNNNTTRLANHDFRVRYPMDTGVFLVNAVLNLDKPDFQRIHPYLGFGMGSAVIAVSNANSTQKTPPQPGVNHYNSNPDDTAMALAVQPKLGLQFDWSAQTRLFVEYRFLYLAGTKYRFGSTAYPDHSPTSNWNVNIGSQYYNVATVGLQYDL